MKFEWDENKRQSNLLKHRIDFLDAKAVFEGEIVSTEDKRFQYHERRIVSSGIAQGRVLTLVYTEREDSIRIISARKATKYEEKNYFSKIPNRLGIH